MCREVGSRCTKTRGRGWSDLPSAMDLKVSFNQLSDDFFLLCLSPPSLFLSLSKCGNFAVLVDLHILPLGGQDNASWFSPGHRKVREWGCVSVCLCMSSYASIDWYCRNLEFGSTLGIPPSSFCFYKIYVFIGPHSRKALNGFPPQV